MQFKLIINLVLKTLVVLCAMVMVSLLALFLLVGPIFLALMPAALLALGVLVHPIVVSCMGLCAYYFWRAMFHGIEAEMQLLKQVGRTRLLWCSNVGYQGVRGLPGQRAVAKAVLIVGWDQTGPLLEALRPYIPLEFEDEDLRSGLWSIGSVCYSYVVEGVWIAAFSRFTLQAMLIAYVASCIALLRYTYETGRRVLLFGIVMVVIALNVPASVYAEVVLFFLRLFATMGSSSDRGLFFSWLSWRFASAVVEVVAWAEALNWEVENKTSATISSSKGRLVAHFRRFVFQGVTLVNDVQLPSFIRRRFMRDVTVSNLQKSNDLLASIGWPVNVELTEPVLDDNTVRFKEWILCGSDMRTGIKNLKCYVDENLETLRIAGVHYRRTEEYMTETNELDATARYFRSPRYDYPDLDVNDVWFIVGDIFRRSKFTTFNYIIQMWEKKYALGAFMRNPVSGKKMSRRTFITSIGGYGPLKKLWARTFYYASSLLPVAHVSVKTEALPQKKWAEDKVRSIIGTPLGHYIMSTFFNYGPNHNFAWETTPIKVGMPLNGFWMSKVFARHSKCQFHAEGDFTAFDSTIDGPVLDMIKAIRKKGYENHKDRDRISDLIDVTYDQISKQLLNTTSTGNVYRKGAGATTGHSATSMDNSVGLVVLYLMAWKELTGLSAREFNHFNELSCFGDDHVLSSLATRPTVWTPSNIMRVMGRWGVKNNMVERKLRDVEFLAKKTRLATSMDEAHMRANGVTPVKHIVWHNKEKLVGKLTARTKSFDGHYRMTRFLSYLGLCAHHEDLYNSIVGIMNNSKSILVAMERSKAKIPTYRQVLKQWYASDAHQPADPEEDLVTTDKILQVGNVGVIDHVLGALSMLPDMLNPAAFNYGYQRLLQARLKDHLQWSFDFICTMNDVHSPSHAAFVLSHTPYRFLDAKEMVGGSRPSNYSSCLIRHWLFLTYMSFRPRRSPSDVFFFVAHKVAFAQFAINGRLHNESRNSSLAVDQILVVALLSLVSIPDWLAPLSHIELPDIYSWMDTLVHLVTVYIWSSVPPNYREVGPALESALSRCEPLLLVAPTGTGKSTGFPYYLYQTYGSKYRDIVVVVPRRALALGLVNYMSNDYGLPCTAGTHGAEYDASKKVKYVTPNFLMGHLELLRNSSLIVIDESHVQEEMVLFVTQLVTRLRLPCVMATATPSASNRENCCVSVELNTPTLWRVNTNHIKVPEGRDPVMVRWYLDDVQQRVKQLAPAEKALVFVSTPEMADAAAKACSLKAIPLSGKHRVPEVWDAKVYFATSVADVGLTIPGLTHVYTMNMAWMEGWIQLTEAMQKQRRGRVGRTGNGTFTLYEVPGTRNAHSVTVNNVKTFSKLLSAGVPPGVLRDFSQDTFCELFNVDAAGIPDPGDLDDILDNISIMVNNVVPISIQHDIDAQADDIDFGPGVSLLADFMQGSSKAKYPLTPDFWTKSFVPYIREVAEAMTNATDLPPSIDIPGTTATIEILEQHLMSRYDEGLPPSLEGYQYGGPGIEDVFEIKRIGDLLREASQLA